MAPALGTQAVPSALLWLRADRTHCDIAMRQHDKLKERHLGGMPTLLMSAKHSSVRSNGGAAGPGWWNLDDRIYALSLSHTPSLPLSLSLSE